VFCFVFFLGGDFGCRTLVDSVLYICQLVSRFSFVALRIERALYQESSSKMRLFDDENTSP
jgi:hypothetical protein